LIVLKFLFIIFAIFWLMRLALGYAFKRFIKNVQDQASEMQRQQQEQFRRYQEAQYGGGADSAANKNETVRIETDKEDKNIYKDDAGEYIDFEEVSD